VRESLFNVLASRIDFSGASVLDLYAGSGALGLEALSRGAASAVFVESDSRAAAVIAKNIASLGAHTVDVRRGPVAAVLAGGTGGWVGAGTVVVVERGTSGPDLTWPDGWEPWPSRRYGDTRVELAEA
jgi:16S rRNA G966 N2-methylase RsmD